MTFFFHAFPFHAFSMLHMENSGEIKDKSKKFPITIKMFFTIRVFLQWRQSFSLRKKKIKNYALYWGTVGNRWVSMASLWLSHYPIYPKWPSSCLNVPLLHNLCESGVGSVCCSPFLSCLCIHVFVQSDLCLLFHNKYFFLSSSEASPTWSEHSTTFIFSLSICVGLR